MDQLDVDNLLQRLDKQSNRDDSDVKREESAALLNVINDFSGSYQYLHIDYPCDVYVEGVGPFPSAGIALAAAQFGLRHIETILKASSYHDAVSALLSEEAFERPEFSSEKSRWLALILRDKFLRHDKLASQLTSTINKKIRCPPISSHSPWLSYPSSNEVGKILEMIREDTEIGSDLEKWLIGQGALSHDKFTHGILRIKENRDGCLPIELQLSGPVPAPPSRSNSEPDNGDQDLFIQKDALQWFGNDESVAVRCLHPSVSKRHAILSLSERGFAIIDVGRRHGTLLNKQRLAPFQLVSLKVNDEIELGEFTGVRFVVSEIDMTGSVKYLQRKLQSSKMDSVLLAASISNSAKVAELEKKASTRLHVKNLPFKISRVQLRDWIEALVPNAVVEDVFFPCDGDRGGPRRPNGAESCERGFGFATMRSVEEAKRAVAILGRGAEMEGRKVFVVFSNEAGCAQRSWGKRNELRDYRDREQTSETLRTGEGAREKEETKREFAGDERGRRVSREGSPAAHRRHGERHGDDSRRRDKDIRERSLSRHRENSYAFDRRRGRERSRTPPYRSSRTVSRSRSPIDRRSRDADGYRSRREREDEEGKRMKRDREPSEVYPAKNNHLRDSVDDADWEENRRKRRRNYSPEDDHRNPHRSRQNRSRSLSSSEREYRRRDERRRRDRSVSSSRYASRRRDPSEERGRRRQRRSMSRSSTPSHHERRDKYHRQRTPSPKRSRSQRDRSISSTPRHRERTPSRSPSMMRNGQNLRGRKVSRSPSPREAGKLRRDSGYLKRENNVPDF
eukprot:GDKK01019438.1.p1 GENE.GDKK01019438.1~~GDKK01019438.1.p1  ORF type:complete len:804 (-),score=154.82 GDKK01019438.1:33-2414(-)